MTSRLLMIALVAAACGTGSDGSGDIASATSSTMSSAEVTSSTTVDIAAGHGGCADVIGVDVRGGAYGFTFDVTVSSDDTGWDKYADAWEVRSSDGAVLGVRVLAHPHENEQPFTRSLSGVDIPESVTEVTVTAQDSVLGFCGESMTVPLPGRS